MRPSYVLLHSSTAIAVTSGAEIELWVGRMGGQHASSTCNAYEQGDKFG